MHRDLLSYLDSWRDDPLRMPLILRGARQVGKSWLAKELGKRFDYFIEINFDLDADAKLLFQHTGQAQHILTKLEFYSGQKVIAGKTLVFLDEIQECPNALKMLRYFKEQHPELHIIAAGSLLEFLLDEIGVPVGRVQFLYVTPLSFAEFLSVSGKQHLRDYLDSKLIDPVIHKQLLEELRNYMWLGGMPAVVDAWLRYHDGERCQRLQDNLLTSYRQDFLKYARKNQVPHIEHVFMSIAQQLGKKFKYASIDNDIKSATLKNALALLIKAGVALPCYQSSGHALPLAANKNSRHFKIFFFDIGLLQRLLKCNLRDWVCAKMDVNYLGSLAEQLVAQEYVAYSSPSEAQELYYWHRESKGANAEVDFLFVKKRIYPVEVKSGIKGGMKSLHVFLKEHPHTPVGLKISQAMPGQQENIEEIPLYGLHAWLKSE